MFVWRLFTVLRQITVTGSCSGSQNIEPGSTSGVGQVGNSTAVLMTSAAGPQGGVLKIYGKCCITCNIKFGANLFAPSVAQINQTSTHSFKNLPFIPVIHSTELWTHEKIRNTKTHQKVNLGYSEVTLESRDYLRAAAKLLLDMRPVF